MGHGTTEMNLLVEIIAALLITVLAVFLYGIFVDRHLVRFPRRRIAVPNLRPAFAGTTMIHISDVHLSALVPAWFIAQLFRKVAALHEDLIVTTGDNVLGRGVPERIDQVWSHDQRSASTARTLVYATSVLGLESKRPLVRCTGFRDGESVENSCKKRQE